MMTMIDDDDDMVCAFLCFYYVLIVFIYLFFHYNDPKATYRLIVASGTVAAMVCPPRRCAKVARNPTKSSSLYKINRVPKGRRLVLRHFNEHVHLWLARPNKRSDSSDRHGHAA